MIVTRILTYYYISKEMNQLQDALFPSLLCAAAKEGNTSKLQELMDSVSGMFIHVTLAPIPPPPISLSIVLSTANVFTPMYSELLFTLL